ncbi:polysaccharide deacetylase family protein [Kitasatospora sp. NBC_00315]|uniref:polysaccharide deacetylase family protein n=1 Tax=Kitasatospora sp. NBC_00315 TaxID=2975963 RepID=UPI0032543947
MPVHGTTRPVFRRPVVRRAVAGSAAVLSLALACACGPSRGAVSQERAAVGGDSVRSAPSSSPSPAASPDGAAGTTPGTANGPAGASNGPSTAAGAASSGVGAGTGSADVPAGGSVAPSGPGPTAPAAVASTPAGPGTPALPAGAAPTTAAVSGAATSAPDAAGSSIVRGTVDGGRSVALTFDDGPGPATGQILDLLAQYHAKATFCEIGPQATAHPALVKRIVAAGHRLCDHTVDHPQPMRTLPHDRQTFEIDTAKDMIVKAGGPGTRVDWFRAPGGDFSPDNRAIARQDGMRPLGWTVDTRDWSRPGAAAIVATAQQELRPGGVILMHDGGGDRSQSVAALGQLLPWLVQQGYTFDFPTG